MHQEMGQIMTNLYIFIRFWQSHNSQVKLFIAESLRRQRNSLTPKGVDYILLRVRMPKFKGKSEKKIKSYSKRFKIQVLSNRNSSRHRHTAIRLFRGAWLRRLWDFAALRQLWATLCGVESVEFWSSSKLRKTFELTRFWPDHDSEQAWNAWSEFIRYIL